jgi:hypothetical protein
MNRISGATAQQSAPIASSTETAEPPVIASGAAKKESSTEVRSHAEAQKQNAVTRQSDNNLTAMIHKERIAESPRAYIPKEDVDALAADLNSRGPAAEGVKEGLAKAYINNGPGQHAKIAECMRQFASAGTDSRAQAYQALKQEMKDLTKFDPSGQTQPAQRNFFKEVSNLRGPGSERVKADVAVMIQHNIEEAKSAKHGLSAFSGMYTAELGKVLQSDTSGIFKTLQNDVPLRKEVPRMMDNLLNHKEGQKAIGGMVTDMAATTTRSLLKSPNENRDAAQRLGYFMGQVESGIERNAKTKEQAIEQGANILGFGLKAAEKLSPGEAGAAFEKVNQGLDWLKNRELKGVEAAKSQLRSTLYDLVDTTFKSVADPYGNLSAGQGDQRKVENYNNARQVYDDEFLKKREDALTRESLR